MQGICKEVDYQVEEYEKWQRLLEIYNKVEARSSGTLKSGKKFRVSILDFECETLQTAKDVTKQWLHEGHKTHSEEACNKHKEFRKIWVLDVLKIIKIQ